MLETTIIKNELKLSVAILIKSVNHWLEDRLDLFTSTGYIWYLVQVLIGISWWELFEFPVLI